MRQYPIGDTCLCWSFSDKIDAGISRLVLAVYRNLRNRQLPTLGIIDLVPSYNAIAVHFDPGCNIRRMGKKVGRIIKGIMADFDPRAPGQTGKRITLPVRYDGEDLGRVAGNAGLSIREVIDRHKASEFTVAMVGFKPHFPYLIGLDERLTTPRLASPRTRIPAGAVAIGGAQTGIYPVESPGGWNLIGSTDPELLKEIRPGDTVIFEEH